MLTCIAIDDEPLALEVLKKYIAKIYFLELKGVFTDPFEAQKLMDASPVDILFLDIQMPKINGFEMLELVEDPPAVIFTRYPPAPALFSAPSIPPVEDWKVTNLL